MKTSEPFIEERESLDSVTSPQLDITDEAAVKILFLSTDPVHVNHDEDPDSSEYNECHTCRLISKYEVGFKKRKLRALKSEIEKKVMRLSTIETNRQRGLPSFQRNFYSINCELPKDHEALMTFCEVLDIMDVKIPESLKKIRNSIIMIHQIPARNYKRNCKLRPEVNVGEKNNFFAYTTNKILAELCDSLTVEHVYALRRAIIDQGKEHTEFDPKLVEAMTSLDVQDEDPKFKDLLFYYIVLNLQRNNLLTRLQNHILKKFIEDSKPKDTDEEQEMVISKSLKKLDRYPMTAKPPGACIIFVMKEYSEEGTDKDVKNLRELFENFFNYDVIVKSDPTKEDIKKYATELGSGRYMSYDSLIVVFLGHGNNSNLIVKNGEMVHRRDEFIAPFVNIGWLQKKPKLFFIQACSYWIQKPFISHGKGLDIGTDSVSFRSPNDPVWYDNYGNSCDGEMINSLAADTLISYATMWYQMASRDENGSLYINTLIETLKESGQKTSIEENLRRMHYKVNTVCLKKQVGNTSSTETWKQTPYYESALEKEFIFPQVE